MKIVFISNYYNHHQSQLCHALARQTDGDFYFIATSEMRKERRDMGYDMEQVPEFVRYAHRSPEERTVCIRLIEEADVLIAGAAPEDLLAPRIRAGKLTFRYTERILRKGRSFAQVFPKYVMQHLRNPRGKPIYLLCAGAYTAADYVYLGLFRDRTYQWGYFPETIRYRSKDDMISEKRPNSILWVARLIELKHPEYAIEVAMRLRKAGYSFTLDLIGAGPMESQLKELISAWELDDCVHMLGALKPNQVREYMEKSSIFLFTSDRQEGWGAVMNEAMNSGCAVVASHAIGSVPYLVNDGENGLIFRSENVDDLFEKTKYLLDHPKRLQQIGVAAYETITEQWNADTAAVRLCELAGRILAGETLPDLYESGPVSRASVLRDDWM